MDSGLYKSKIAFDKNGKKLGKIIGVRKTFNPSQHKETKVIIVSKKPFWHKSVSVPLAINSVLKNGPRKVFFDIEKKDFDLFVKKLVAFRKLKTKNAKLHEASSTEKAIAQSFSFGKI